MNKDYEKIIEIKDQECENCPKASEETRNTYSALDDALNDYINAVQNDAFYFGYITAMKQISRKEIDK